MCFEKIKHKEHMINLIQETSAVYKKGKLLLIKSCFRTCIFFSKCITYEI